MGKESSDKKKRLAVAGAAGLTPFAGLIGKTKELNPMAGKEFATSSDLARQAQKGDILMAGAPGRTLSGGFNKTFINMGIGKPAGYHPTIVEGVTPDGRLTVLEHGPDKGWQRKTLGKDSQASLSLLRQKSQAGATSTVDTARRYVAANEKLGTELLKHGLPEEEVLRIQKQAYSHRMNPAIGMRELFLPKGRSKTSVATQRAGADKALHFFEQNTAQIAENLANKSKAGQKITLSDLKCLGGVCTTVAAKSGVPVRAGTNLQYTSPNDILGSGKLRNVGYKRAVNSGTLGQRALHGVLRHAPNLVRGAAGVGLGALAYQGAKKIWPGEKTAGVLESALPRTVLEILKAKKDIKDKGATTKADVHKAADKAGIPWDNDPSFKRVSEEVTGKAHLDNMTPDELHKMKRVIQSKGILKTAKPTIANQGEDYTGNIATGAAGAGLMAPKAIEPMLGKDVTRYKPGKPIHIYYTDPDRGRGHKQQAQNIATALKRKGIPYELINVEQRYTTPAARKHLIDTYKRVMNGELSHGAWKKEWTKFYLTQVDKGALKAEAKGAGGVILTNPGLAPWMRGVMPSNIVVSDPSKAMIDTPLGTSWTRAQDTKYVPESIKDGYKGPNVRRISNVPLDPEMFDRYGPSPFNPKRSHVTVSGGGTGTDVLKQVEQLMGAKTREIKGKPLTIHAITGSLRKTRPGDYQRLLQMAEESGGRLIVHDKLPHDKLRPMLQMADANVLRPHGTMGTEAVVAKKPMILSARGGLGGDAKARYATGMNYSNALKFSELTGAPIAGTGGQTTRANLGQVFDQNMPKLDDLGKGVGEAASKFSDTATSITDDIIKRPKIHAPGRIPFSKQMAVAGGVLAGGAGLHALYKRYRGKDKPMKKVSMRLAWATQPLTQFERMTMDDLRDDGYVRGITKAAAVMGLIKTANGALTGHGDGSPDLMRRDSNSPTGWSPAGVTGTYKPRESKRYYSHAAKGDAMGSGRSKPKPKPVEKPVDPRLAAALKDSQKQDQATTAAKSHTIQARVQKQLAKGNPVTVGSKDTETVAQHKMDNPTGKTTATWKGEGITPVGEGNAVKITPNQAPASKSNSFSKAAPSGNPVSNPPAGKSSVPTATLKQYRPPGINPSTGELNTMLFPGDEGWSKGMYERPWAPRGVNVDHLGNVVDKPIVPQNQSKLTARGVSPIGAQLLTSMMGQGLGAGANQLTKASLQGTGQAATGKVTKPILTPDEEPNVSKRLESAVDAGLPGGKRERGSWVAEADRPKVYPGQDGTAHDPYFRTGYYTSDAKVNQTKPQVAPSAQGKPTVAKGDFNIKMKPGQGYGYLSRQLKAKGIDISHKDLRARMGDQMLYRNKSYTFNPSEFAEGSKGLVSGRRGDAKKISKGVATAQRGLKQWEGGGRAKFLAARKAKADAAKADAAKPTVAKETAPKAAPPISDELAGSPAHQRQVALADSQPKRTQEKPKLVPKVTGSIVPGSVRPLPQKPVVEAKPKVEAKPVAEAKPVVGAANLFGSSESTPKAKPETPPKVDASAKPAVKPAPAYVPSMIRDAQTAVGKSAPTAVAKAKLPDVGGMTQSQRFTEFNTPGLKKSNPERYQALLAGIKKKNTLDTLQQHAGEMDDSAAGIRDIKAHAALGSHLPGTGQKKMDAIREKQEAKRQKYLASAPKPKPGQKFAPTTQKDLDDFHEMQHRFKKSQDEYKDEVGTVVDRGHARGKADYAVAAKKREAVPASEDQGSLEEAIGSSARSYKGTSLEGRSHPGYNPSDSQGFRNLQSLKGTFGGEKGGLHGYLSQHGDYDPAKRGASRAWDGKPLKPDQVRALVARAGTDGKADSVRAIQTLYQSGNIDALKGMLKRDGGSAKKPSQATKPHVPHDHDGDGKPDH